MGLDLRELRKPLEDVTFPNGATHSPVPFGPTEYQLWRDIQKETDPRELGRMGVQIIRACYPTVTDDDILDCDGDMLLALSAYPGGKIEQVRAALKNVAAVVEQTAPATPTPPPQTEAHDTTPSSPRTSGATSSPKSRKRSARTGGTSTSAALTEVLT